MSKGNDQFKVKMQAFISFDEIHDIQMQLFTTFSQSLLVQEVLPFFFFFDPGPIL